MKEHIPSTDAIRRADLCRAHNIPIVIAFTCFIPIASLFLVIAIDLQWSALSVANNLSGGDRGGIFVWWQSEGEAGDC